MKQKFQSLVSGCAKLNPGLCVRDVFPSPLSIPLLIVKLAIERYGCWVCAHNLRLFIL